MKLGISALQKHPPSDQNLAVCMANLLYSLVILFSLTKFDQYLVVTSYSFLLFSMILDHYEPTSGFIPLALCLAHYVWLS